MLCKSRSTSRHPSAVPKTGPFAGEGPKNVFGNAMPCPFRPSALLRFSQSKTAYPDFLLPLLTDDDDLDLLFPASVSQPIQSQPQALKEAAKPLPSSSITEVDLIKESETLDVYRVASRSGLPYCLVDNKFGRAEDALKAAMARMAQPRSSPAAKQTNPDPPQVCAPLKGVNIPECSRSGNIPDAVDPPSTTEEDSLEVESIDAPLPPIVPISPSPAPAPASSSSNLSKPLSRRKASSCPAKRNPRKRSKLHDDDEDFVDGPASKKRRAPVAKTGSTIRAPGTGVTCTSCDKWCKNQGDMDRHIMRDDHGSVKLPCLVDTCSKKFTRDDALKRHLLRKHRWTNAEWEEFRPRVKPPKVILEH